MTAEGGIGTRLVPALLVQDMRETLEFYRRLGFQVAGHNSESDPTWAEVERDSVKLQFYTDPPPGTPTAPICSGTFYLSPANVSDLAEEFRGKVDFVWGPEVMDYGSHEFGVKDPNGYYLAFTEPA